MHEKKQMKQLTNLEEFHDLVKSNRAIVLVMSEFNGTSRYLQNEIEKEYYYAILLGYLNKRELNCEVGIINIDEIENEFGLFLEQYKILSIPIVLYFKNGEKTSFSIGLDNVYIDFLHFELGIKKDQ